MLLAPRAILDSVNSRADQTAPPNVQGENITITAGDNGIALIGTTANPNEKTGAGGVGTPGDFLEIHVNADPIDATHPLGVLTVTDIAAQRADTSLYPVLPLPDVSNVLGAGSGTFGVFITETAGILELNTVTTNGDASLTTDNGSIADARGSTAAGINTANTILPPNIIANNVDLQAIGGSIGSPD